MNKIKIIREEEKKYHDHCYEQYKLFEKGSWLHKPVKTVLHYMSYFEKENKIEVLDLGCGVGRNSIPIAQMMISGKVVCVDLLDSALEKLISYCKIYGVEKNIVPIKADISQYEIQESEFDYIVAVSSLEHVDSEKSLDEVLKRIVNGTKQHGINCLIVNSNVQEVDVDTGDHLEPLLEVQLTTDQMIEKLKNSYLGWEELMVAIKPLEYQIQRDGRDILLKTEAITFVVRKDGK